MKKILTKKPKRKSILILVSDDKWKEKTVELEESYHFFYRAWSKAAEKMNVDLLRSSTQYFHNGKFEKHWQLKKGVWVKVPQPVLPTVVFGRVVLFGAKIQQEYDGIYKKLLEIIRYVPIVNDPEFMSLFGSKLNQALVFRDSMPSTKFVYPGDVLPKGADPLVVKAFHGYGGYQVEIVKGKRYIATQRGIAQNFVRASRGGTVQDYRIVFLGTKPVYALTRVAKKGSLFTNFYQGGSIILIDLKKIKPIVRCAEKIAKPLGIFRKAMYSLDFMVDSRNHKPYLIELNYNPGNDMFTEESREEMEKFVVTLTKYLLS